MSLHHLWASAWCREELRTIARDVVRMGRMATKPELHHLAAKLNRYALGLPLGSHQSPGSGASKSPLCSTTAGMYPSA